MSGPALKDTVVLVTGGAGGLGLAITTAYLAAGARVAICDINEARLTATASKLSDQYPGRTLAVRSDITSEADVQTLVDKVVEEFGRLDILVNNAGVADAFDPVAELTKEKWDRVLGVNLTGSFLCARAAVNAFLKQDPSQGLLIQIGSNSSFSGNLSGLAYTVSKHGVAGLVKHTADFYGDKGVYTVGLMLGAMVDTNIAESMGGWNREAYEKSAVSSLDHEKGALKLADVSRFCVMISERGMAESLNGTCVSFTKNWPKA